MNTPSEQTFRFEVLTGSRKGEIIPLRTGEIKVGRSSRSNDVVIEDPTVSREHLRIRISPTETVVEDLGSSHGSFVNGTPLKKPMPLRNTDILRVGVQELRFECTGAPSAAEAPRTSALPAPPVPDDSGDAGGTRFMPVQQQAEKEPEEKYEATRVFQAEGTRMLDEKELAGLKAGIRHGSGGRRNLIVGVALLAALLAGAAVYVVMRDSGGASADGTPVEFKDPQYNYAITRPGNWRQKTGEKGSSLRFVVRDAKGRDAGNVDVYADRSLEYGTAGLTMGFENYQTVLLKRHEGFELLGSKPMTINEVKVIFFGFESKAGQGKAIYTQDGDLQIVVECLSPRKTYKGVASAYTDVLQSFAFVKGQRYIDYPKPDEAQRKVAVADPARLIADAQQEDKLGQELFRLKSVRPENLYNAIQHFKSALQKLSALGTKPPFFADVAQRLKQANTTFDNAVRDQWFRITSASKQQDYGQAQLEASRLLMMIPDKRDPLYREAYNATQEYSE